MSFTLKIVGAMCVVLCTTAVGFSMSEKLRQRSLFLCAFDRFLVSMETQLRYSTDEILSLIEASTPKEIKAYFDFDSSDLYALWNSFLTSIPASKGLREEDFKLLYDFGENLGSTDVEGQLSRVRLFREMLSENYENSLEEYKSKSKVYKLLGFFVGAVFTIMLF